jgi:hypothetical protein
MDNSKVNKLVDETLNSMDGAQRATPAPYLLTRINARLKDRRPTSSWDFLGQVLARPVTAFATIILVFLINLFIYTSNDNDPNGTSSSRNNPGLIDDYSMTNATAIYDLENLQQ